MNSGKLVVGVELKTKKFDAQIEETKHKIEELEEIAKVLELHIDIGDNKEQLIKVNTEIEKLKNNLVDLHKKQRGNTDFGFKEGLKDLKKFALGLIGIRGLYSLARKASSTWLSQDTELAKKFESIWLGISALMKPVLEWLADIMYKLLGYLNEFVKAFTGGNVDLIATANAKAIEKQAKAMKELKNQTYGFDELNIQQENDTSSSSSATTIPEIKLNPKIKKFVQDVGKALGDVYGWLKKIADWVDDHLGANGDIALGLLILLGVSALTGNGLLAILTAIIAIYETIKNIRDLLDAWGGFKKASEDLERNANAAEKTTQKYKDLTEENNNYMKSGKATEQEQKKWIDSLDDLNESMAENSDSLKNIRTNSQSTKKSQEELLNQSKLLTDSYELMNDTYGLSKDSAEKYIKALETQRTIMKNLGQDTTEIDQKIALVRSEMEQFDNTDANAQIKITINAEDKTKPIIDKASKNLSDFAKKFGINLGQKAIKGADPLTLGLSGLGQTLEYILNPKNFGLKTGGILNKSALGSIVNNPGKGVYVGANTIAGEAGKEGVIPLTDPNAMTELGETIGRYITVNLTNITKLDSKIINKTNNTISNDMNFIRNGGGA